ncbi:RNA polymerase sigma-70 factor (ECF subfamily) [Rhodovulum iodosum]|uniref:RNA polymerase sigma factor n=1 Tax=Rhodovulum iodosum TaxID=68291 RepID=A0ABV3XTT3_9RHOB|nr:sigma-70 family RNA polymerase sigma factor [Rhodovulum robiginosum]RSK32181.1 sigma-70 family RNA polymerase sigma factor [Rhodovulum robiginosum]
MTTRDDIEAMIARVALRDHSAFSSLYDATSAKLFGVCLRVLNNRSEAEEVLQDVYVRVWNKAGTYSVTGHSPMTWLITVARNLSIDRLRARETRTGGIDRALDIVDDRPGPEEVAVARSARAAIDDCLDELDTARADAVKRAYLDGDTYKDLAHRYDVPVNTMRTWLRRSLIKLRDCLTR